MFSEVFEVTYVAPLLPNAVLEFAANNIIKQFATVTEVNIISEASIYVIFECIHSNRKKIRTQKTDQRTITHQRLSPMKVHLSFN